MGWLLIALWFSVSITAALFLGAFIDAGKGPDVR